MKFVSDTVQMARDPFYIPKGATPNKYTPHQGKKEIAKRLRKAGLPTNTG